jgi:hypothetical protein
MELTMDEEREEEVEREMEESMCLLSNRTVANSMHVEERFLRMISTIPPDESKSNQESMDDDDEVRRRISWRLVERRWKSLN